MWKTLQVLECNSWTVPKPHLLSVTAKSLAHGLLEQLLRLSCTELSTRMKVESEAHLAKLLHAAKLDHLRVCLKLCLKVCLRGCPCLKGSRWDLEMETACRCSSLIVLSV